MVFGIIGAVGISITAGRQVNTFKQMRESERRSNLRKSARILQQVGGINLDNQSPQSIPANVIYEDAISADSDFIAAINDGKIARTVTQPFADVFSNDSSYTLGLSGAVQPTAIITNQAFTRVVDCQTQQVLLQQPSEFEYLEVVYSPRDTAHPRRLFTQDTNKNLIVWGQNHSKIRGNGFCPRPVRTAKWLATRNSGKASAKSEYILVAEDRILTMRIANESATLDQVASLSDISIKSAVIHQGKLGVCIVATCEDGTARTWTGGSVTELRSKTISKNLRNGTVFLAARAAQRMGIRTDSQILLFNRDPRRTSFQAGPSIDGTFLDAAFSNDPNSELVVTTDGNSVQSWDVYTGERRLTYPSSQNVVAVAFYREEYLIGVTSDGRIIKWRGTVRDKRPHRHEVTEVFPLNGLRSG